MSETYTTTIHMSKGYSGKEAAYSKGYVARITDLDSRYGFARTFIEGKILGSDYYRKSKCSWEVEYELEPGLYELSEGGERYLWMVSLKDGNAVRTTVSIERIKAMIVLMNDGQSFNEARLATKPASK